MMFSWPTDVKRITSHFRDDRKDHHGIDIARSGYHEIKAAAAGTVRSSYRSQSYGECIMLTHVINGVKWETVYAHMDTGSRTVQEGDKVKSGQKIGIMGNTGYSSGQHLHFELHRGAWNANKTNAVNPLDYLTETPTKHAILYYIVKKGDTLSEIARRHHSTVEKLARLNNISDIDMIQIGQRIRVSGESQKTKHYIVRPGDTLSEIAKRNKTSVPVLVKINKIPDKNVIQIGQKIKLP